MCILLPYPALGICVVLMSLPRISKKKVEIRELLTEGDTNLDLGQAYFKKYSEVDISQAELNRNFSYF